jgi:streptomycin 6-kinase
MTLRAALAAAARERGIALEGSVHATRTSAGCRGLLNQRPVYLKVLAEDSDERDAGQLLATWRSNAVVGIVDWTSRVQVLEWIEPGVHLRDRYSDLGSEGCAVVLGTLALQLHALDARSAGYRDAMDRGASLLSGRCPACVDRVMWDRAGRTYLDLARSQRDVGVIHGDLHHFNVLRDVERGWVAIDPKGVVADIEFELACALRNPIDLVDRWADAQLLGRTAIALADAGAGDAERLLRWSFAQCVLAAAWEVEDGLDPLPWVKAATAHLPLLGTES